METDALRCSVSELMAAFRQALVALVPTAERLKMNWRDEYQHRDWERMAEAVFDACVRGPIEADAGHRGDESPLPRYDIDDPPYFRCSWIRVGSMKDPSPVVLIRLVTDREPFDTVQGVKVDPRTFAPGERLAVPFSESHFTFVRRSDGESDEVIHEIEAVD